MILTRLKMIIGRTPYLTQKLSDNSLEPLQRRLEDFRTEDTGDTEGTEARKEFLIKEIINKLLLSGSSVTRSLSSVFPRVLRASSSSKRQSPPIR